MNDDTALAHGGLLLLNKAKGVTSFTEINKLKKIFGISKCGHAGTLDKEAEGLLLVGIGKATKLLKFLVGCDKVYTGEIKFGTQTSTDDSAGEPINHYSGEISYELIQKHLAHFQGTITQTPPNYSAVHVNGKRAYKIALSGETPDIHPRTVTIYKFVPLNFTNTTLTVQIHCSSGTYIRSLARDLGLQTGYYGYLSNLRRDHVAHFSLDQASSIAEIEMGKYILIDPVDILHELPTLSVTTEHLPYIKNGKQLHADIFTTPPEKDGLYKIICDNALVAITQKTNNKLSYNLVY